MNWLEVKFNINKNQLEFYSDLLLELGAHALTETSSTEQAIFQLAPDEQPKWENITLIGLFNADIDLNKLKKHINQDIIINKLAKQDWQNNYKQYLKPIKFGDNLWVSPSWQNVPDKNALNIILDPGQAFGTGTHATTSLCLKWLEKNIKPEKSQTIMDYGCGSGILAIAALKLGAKQAYAVDIDPLALEVTEFNTKQNNIVDNLNKLIISTPKLLNIEINKNIQNIENNQSNKLEFDILVANILAKPLISLAKEFAILLKTNGTIVLSGILEIQAKSVISHYAKYFTDFNIEQEEEWVRIYARKK